ncbi:putative exodeoxyribonuclease VII large subunit [Selenomonas ruminantium subsp. lactilytica TAM6421]|uniref:Exodeoxyribonuclease 7 large subunit n=1 Tax=Selenomonas ruminantium subsp. lactilytica (strain NBRC 103574 / TAM6421) TaxID=927704 RepID=I0GQ85_SELRL|nr:exodeoxyribonuclease VII large subunit [Selenomonas ruminantium]BAL82922.1 putative exodeoxyribonuclease VII large subunit [Selenomonas ruminantium subsp. lactilytica TAM6421]
MGVHSVSDINRFLKNLLASEPILRGIAVRGEISNFKKYPSGHCYFTLKDASSALKCVMFRSYAGTLRFMPQNGMQVVAAGSVSVYERDGVYQLYVESMLPEGTGDLALAFEQLKEKLAAEGLFDQSRKRPLPPFPKRIGVVTSSAGAVLRDIYRVSKRRWPQVQLVLYPVQVQGEGAAEQIAAGIGFFSRKYPVDVIIAGRGGGSMEDLWAFNEEVVVRAIAAAKVPLISAVGHETDFTLADFAADMRAATPSQAAELAVPDQSEVRRQVENLTGQLTRQMQGAIAARRTRLENILQSRVLRDPQSLLAERRQRLDFLLAGLQKTVQADMQDKRHRLGLLLNRLAAINPAAVMGRGYGLLTRQDKLITSVNAVAVNDELDVTLRDGIISVRALTIREKGDR